MHSDIKINFEIAGYKFLLFAKDEVQLFIDPVYANFLVTNDREFDIKINVNKGFSAVNVNLSADSQDIENVFAAKIPDTNSFEIPQRDWNVFTLPTPGTSSGQASRQEVDTDFYIRIFSLTDKNKTLPTPETSSGQAGRKVETIVKVNNSKEWDIFIHEDKYKENIVEPLQHPVGSLILYYLTALHGDIFLHSSGVFDRDKGRIFTGISGAGKSTLAGIWDKAEALLIHDDRLILRKDKDNWYMHNTPVYLNDVPKFTKVDELFLIKHASENNYKELTGAIAAARLFACCIQHDFDKILVEKLLNSVADLISHTKVYELGFVPNEKVIDYIKNLKSCP